MRFPKVRWKVRAASSHPESPSTTPTRSLVPLDFDTVLESVARTRRAVVAHEAWRFGGFGAELAAQLHAELEAPVGVPLPEALGSSIRLHF